MKLKEWKTKHKYIIALDLDLGSNTIWSARFSFNPFQCERFKYRFLVGDHLEAILAILQEVMNWRTWEPDSVVLIPHGLVNADWSALFCNYAQRLSNGSLMFSMCGPIEGWFLTPVDPNILLYVETYEIRDRMSEHIVNMRIIEEFGIPHPDKWDWRLAATIAYLYNIGNYDLKEEPDKPKLIFF